MRRLFFTLFTLMIGCAAGSAKSPTTKFHSLSCDTILDCIDKAADACNDKGFSICSPKHFLTVQATPGVKRTIEVQCKSEQTTGVCQ